MSGYISKEVWEKEYSSGAWDVLEDSLQKARAAVIGMYCNHFHPSGKILDVGCGECVLFDSLSEDQKKNYLGIDLSEVAITNAKNKRNVQAIAVSADAFNPGEKYDVIIFNEVIYYLDYEKALAQYNALLNYNGIIIFSISKSVSPEMHEYQVKIWEAIRRTFVTHENIELLGNTATFKWTWEIEVLRKRS